MANQTIIQAPGQRWAPIKIDYSGYIQGIASITSALVEKRKQNLKKNETFGKLTMNAKHPHLDDNIVFLRDNVYGESVEGQNLVQGLLEKITQNNASLEDPEFLEELTKQYKNMSLSVGLEKQNYWNTMLSGDFSGKRQIIVGEGVVSEIEVNGEMKESTTYTTLDNLLESGVYNENEIIEIIKKEGLRDVIMGADGNYIDVEDFQSTIRTKIGVGSDLYKEIDRTVEKLIPIKESTGANIDPDNTWNSLKKKSVKKIMNMVKEDEDMLLSAMTDLSYPIGSNDDLVPDVAGSEDNFMDWILASDPAFLKYWNEFLETEEGEDMSGDKLERTKAAMIVDFYQSNNRLVDEFEIFLNAVYQSHDPSYEYKQPSRPNR